MNTEAQELHPETQTDAAEPACTARCSVISADAASTQSSEDTLPRMSLADAHPPHEPLHAPQRDLDAAGEVVHELRSRLAELLSHERELERRELELLRWERRLADQARTDAQSPALETAGEAPPAPDADHLERRAAEITLQSDELTRREAELTERATLLRDERDALEQRRAQQRLDLASKFRRLREREASLATKTEAARAEIERLSRAARAAPPRMAARSAESAADEAALATLARERQTLRRAREELESRAAKLQDEESAIAATWAQLAQERRRFAAERDAAAAQADARPDRQAQFTAAARAELAASWSEVERRWAALDARVWELDARAEAIDREQSRLAASLCAFEERAIALDRRAAELTQRAAQLAARWAELDAREIACTQQAAELQSREEALTAERERLAQRSESMNAAQRSQTQQQRTLDTQRAELAAEQDKLSLLRIQLEDDLGRVRASLGAEPAPPPGPIRGGLGLRGWIRLLGAAAALGLGAVLAAHQTLPQRVELRASFRATAALGNHDLAAAEHAARLLSGRNAAALLGAPELAERWQRAVAAHFAAAAPSGLPGEVTLRVASAAEEAPAAAELLSQVLNAYAAHGARVPRSHLRPTTDDRPAELAVIDERRAVLQKRLDECAAQLRPLADWSAWEQARASVTHGVEQYSTLEAELERTRSGLAALQSQIAGAAPLDPAAVETALAQDAMYAADRTEMLASLREYQTELAVALMVVTEPLREQRARVAGLLTALREQMDQPPSSAVASVLEQITTDIQAFDRRLAEFAVGWEAARQAVERHNTETQEGAVLLQRQRAAADTLRSLVEDVTGVIERQRERIGVLTGDPEPGTREVVVAAMLRGELGRIDEASAQLLNAVRAADLAHNARLDAKDHQVRGVLARLKERTDLIRANLQKAADADAAARLSSDVQGRAAAVARLENQRVELWPQVLRAAGAAHEIGVAVTRRAALEAEQKSLREQLGLLDQQRAAVEQRPANTSEVTLPTDEVVVGPLVIEPLDETLRRRLLIGTGIGVFIIAAGAGLLGTRAVRLRQSPTAPRSNDAPGAGWPM